MAGKLCEWDQTVLLHLACDGHACVLTQELRACRRLARKGLMEERSRNVFYRTPEGKALAAKLLSSRGQEAGK